MNEKKKEETKKPEVKLPQLHYVILGDCVIYTDKGMCQWQTPSNMTLEDNIKYLQFAISKFEAQIEANKKKEEEEKPPAENKEKEEEFKKV